jgi:hypothetical protein
MWLSTVLVISAIGAAMLISGGGAAEPMERMIKDATATEEARV